MVSPAAYVEAVAAAGRKPPMPAAAVAAIYERYQQEKRRQHLVDFDDLLLACAQALETDAAFAATQRWRFRHLFVDEFQDVNPLQFRLLEAWRDGRDDLCVVGDPRQAIYSWNGADPRYLTDFARRFPGATVVHLDENHRSSPQVVAVANAVLDGIGGHPLRAPGADGPLPTVTSYASDGEEARERGAGPAPAGRPRPLVRPGRAGPHPRPARGVRGPAEGGGHPLPPAGGVGLPRPARGQGRPGRPPPPPRRPPGRASCPTSTPRPWRPPTSASGAPTSRSWPARPGSSWPSTRAHRSAASWPGSRPAWPARSRRCGARPSTWPPSTRPRAWSGPSSSSSGFEQGLLPIGHAATPEARAEERRLLYVAVTRAERELHFSWAERRTFGTGTMTRSPSPWLDAIEGAVLGLEQARSPQRRRLAQLRGRRPGPAPVRPPAGGGRPGPANRPTRTCSRPCGRGGRPRRGRRACPPSSSSTTPPWPPWPRPGPATGSSLLALPGMGPVKADRYGDAAAGRRHRSARRRVRRLTSGAIGATTSHASVSVARGWLALPGPKVELPDLDVDDRRRRHGPARRWAPGSWSSSTPSSARSSPPTTGSTAPRPAP